MGKIKNILKKTGDWIDSHPEEIKAGLVGFYAGYIVGVLAGYRAGKRNGGR